MRKVLMLLAAAVVMPVAASAQSTATASMSLSAAVIKGITLTKTSAAAGIDFGTIVAGGNPGAVAATGASAIAFMADGQVSQPITITFSSTDLTDGTNFLTFTPSVISGTSNVQASAATVLTNAGRTLDATTGKHYFWVGGSVTAPGSQVAGTYTGTWSLTVNYTGF